MQLEVGFHVVLTEGGGISVVAEVAAEVVLLVVALGVLRKKPLTVLGKTMRLTSMPADTLIPSAISSTSVTRSSRI